MVRSKAVSPKEVEVAAESAGPLYADLASRLIREIEQGTYPVGSQFPTEHELGAIYGMSRFTVRAALESLRKKGYVTRRPKVGTVVIADTPQTRYVISVTGSSDMLRFSRELKYQVLGTAEVTADLALARELDCSLGESWLRVIGCRVTPRTNLAVCLVDYYVRPEHRSAVANMSERSGATPIYTRIEREAGEPVLELRQEITAHTIQGNQSQLLQVEEGNPAVRMVHKLMGRDATRPLYAIVSIYPAERFSFTQTLKLDTN